MTTEPLNIGDVDAGIAGRVAPALLPMYTDERIRERQLTTNYVGNVR